MPKITNYWKGAGLAKKVALSLPVLLVVLGIGVVVANLVGVAMWKIEKARIEGMGETLNFAETLPPSIPDEENFCATPALRGLHLEENIQKLERLEYLIDWHSDTTSDYQMISGSVNRGRVSNISEYLAYLEEAEPGAFDSTPLEEIGEKLLVLLNEKDSAGVYEELARVAMRKRSQFIPGWKGLFENEERVVPDTSYLISYQQFCRTTALRATAAAYARNEQQFVESVEIHIQCTRAILSEPIIFAELIGITCLGGIIDVIWEQLSIGGLSEDALRRIDSSLASLDLQEDFLRSMRGELAFMASGIAEAMEKPKLSDVYDGRLGKVVEEVFFRPGLIGFMRKDIVNYCFDSILVPASHGWPELAKIVAWKRSSSEEPHLSHYIENATSSRDMFAAISRMMISAQSTLSCARTAVALELYFAEFGHYPESLDEVGMLLEDPVAGETIRYRKDEANGRYLLWSVGFDGEDDQGKILPEPEEGEDFPKFLNSDYEGDWVWKYPMVN